MGAPETVGMDLHTSLAAFFHGRDISVAAVAVAPAVLPFDVASLIIREVFLQNGYEGLYGDICVFAGLDGCVTAVLVCQRIESVVAVRVCDDRPGGVVERSTGHEAVPDVEDPLYVGSSSLFGNRKQRV